jgi:hypothetical protein
MVVAFGTDLKVPLDDLPVDNFVAGVAFDPELVRELQLFALLLHSLRFYPLS